MKLTKAGNKSNGGSKLRAPSRERLILALDVDGTREALRLVDALGDAVCFYKLGLQLFTSEGYFELLRELRDRGKRIFADLKLHDIPQTVGSAIRNLSRHGVDLVTVHGQPGVMRAAAEHKGGMRVLAVTVLTSVDQAELAASGVGMSVEELVRLRARQALELGCDGVVASGQEAGALRAELGRDFVLVTPGVRPDGYAVQDDQKRVVTITEALRAGADYVVVGRPILRAPDPRRAAAEIQASIAASFPEG